MLCLTACSTTKEIPTGLLDDCPHATKPTERTNEALADYVKRERRALDVCNTDKAALRAWAATK